MISQQSLQILLGELREEKLLQFFAAPKPHFSSVEQKVWFGSVRMQL